MHDDRCSFAALLFGLMLCSGCSQTVDPVASPAKVNDTERAIFEPSATTPQAPLDPTALLVLNALRAAESFEIYSLQPGIRRGETLDKYDFQFHGWPLLGKIEITHPESHAKILKAVEAMVGPHAGPGAPCFMPRHGLRLMDKEGPLEVVICFECGWLHVYRGKEQIGGLAISGGQKEFDQVLRQYNVSLPDARTQFLDPFNFPAPPPPPPEDALPPLELDRK
jgi:hypothetical protein